VKQFEEKIPVLDLPLDYARPAVQGFAGRSINFGVGEEEAKALRTLAMEEKATLYMVLLAIFNILLSKLSGQEDIVVGTPTAGRRHAEIQQVIGMFVNTLALVNYPEGSKTFREFLGEVKERSLSAFENQEYQFEDLVEKVSVNRDVGRNALFDVMFALQNMGTAEIRIGTPGKRLKVTPYDYENRVSKFDMTLTAMEIGEGGPIVKISEMEIIPEKEKQEILYDFNDTEAGYAGAKTIHEMFEEQAVRTSDSVAVVCAAQRQITYGELSRKSHRVAVVLREKGVLADDIVGIKMEPSIDMIIGIMGILKAGGAYLPIDPDYPQERIDYMLKDSGAKVLLSEVSEELPAQLTHFTHPTQLCYIIYTSGTTGKPKGVMLTHGNLVNYVSWFTGAAGLTGKDKTLLCSSFVFDLGYTSIYTSILSGAELHIVPRETYLLPEQLLNYIRANGISYLKITPSLFTAPGMRSYKNDESLWSHGGHHRFCCPVYRFQPVGGL
jgi:non-ribosomal peptide synthetase component F